MNDLDIAVCSTEELVVMLGSTPSPCCYYLLQTLHERRPDVAPAFIERYYVVRGDIHLEDGRLCVHPIQACPASFLHN